MAASAPIVKSHWEGISRSGGARVLAGLPLPLHRSQREPADELIRDDVGEERHGDGRDYRNGHVVLLHEGRCLRHGLSCSLCQHPHHVPEGDQAAVLAADAGDAGRLDHRPVCDVLPMANQSAY